MGKRLRELAILSLALGLAAAASADWREYRVSARYSGLQAADLPEDQGYPNRAQLEKNMLNGFSSQANCQVFVSDGYTELAEPSPDWQNGKILPRIHGWDDKRYFSASSKLGTIGTTITLEQHIPLGQRLLLSSKDLPAKVFQKLSDKAKSTSDGLAEINSSKTLKVTSEGGSLHDYFLAGDEWIKIGVYKVLPDGSLLIRRLRPDGSIVTEQTWSQPKLLKEEPVAVPLWDRWKHGTSVRDVRIPGMGKQIRWRGPDSGPEQKSAGIAQASSIKTVWLIPGAVLFVLGLGMVVFNSVWKPRSKSNKG